MKSVFVNHITKTEKNRNPLPAVLSQQLQQELQRLAHSLRAQVRNAIAVTNWLQRQNTAISQGQDAGLNPNFLAPPNIETLTFRFVSSPEAFDLFTATLGRRSFFLHYHSQTDRENQQIKVRLKMAQLPEWEQELSILFENITIAVYLDTLLSHQQQSTLPKRKAS